MEHVVQIGVNVDDEAIKKAVISNVTKIVEKAIFPNGVSQYSYYSSSLSKEFQTLVSNCVDHFLAEVKEDIVTVAAGQIAARLCKSSKFREAVISAVDTIEDEE